MLSELPRTARLPPPMKPTSESVVERGDGVVAYECFVYPRMRRRTIEGVSDIICWVFLGKMSHDTVCLSDVHPPRRRLNDSFSTIFHDTVDGFFREHIIYQSDPYEVVHVVKISDMLMHTFTVPLWNQFTFTLEFDHGTNVECLMVHDSLVYIAPHFDLPIKLAGTDIGTLN